MKSQIVQFALLLRHLARACPNRRRRRPFDGPRCNPRRSPLARIPTRTRTSRCSLRRRRPRCRSCVPWCARARPHQLRSASPDGQRSPRRFRPRRLPSSRSRPTVRVRRCRPAPRAGSAVPTSVNQPSRADLAPRLGRPPSPRPQRPSHSMAPRIVRSRPCKASR